MNRNFFRLKLEPLSQGLTVSNEEFVRVFSLESDLFERFNGLIYGNSENFFRSLNSKSTPPTPTRVRSKAENEDEEYQEEYEEKEEFFSREEFFDFLYSKTGDAERFKKLLSNHRSSKKKFVDILNLKFPSLKRFQKLASSKDFLDMLELAFEGKEKNSSRRKEFLDLLQLTFEKKDATLEPKAELLDTLKSMLERRNVGWFSKEEFLETCKSTFQQTGNESLFASEAVELAESELNGVDTFPELISSEGFWNLFNLANTDQIGTKEIFDLFESIFERKKGGWASPEECFRGLSLEFRISPERLEELISSEEFGNLLESAFERKKGGWASPEDCLADLTLTLGRSERFQGLIFSKKFPKLLEPTFERKSRCLSSEEFFHDLNRKLDILEGFERLVSSEKFSDISESTFEKKEQEWVYAMEFFRDLNLKLDILEEFQGSVSISKKNCFDNLKSTFEKKRGGWNCQAQFLEKLRSNFYDTLDRKRVLQANKENKEAFKKFWEQREKFEKEIARRKRAEGERYEEYAEEYEADEEDMEAKEEQKKDEGYEEEDGGNQEAAGEEETMMMEMDIDMDEEAELGKLVKPQPLVPDMKLIRLKEFEKRTLRETVTRGMKYPIRITYVPNLYLEIGLMKKAVIKVRGKEIPLQEILKFIFQNLEFPRELGITQDEIEELMEPSSYSYFLDKSINLISTLLLLNKKKIVSQKNPASTSGSDRYATKGNYFLSLPTKFRKRTFQMKYHKKLSPVSRILLGSFQNKYLYYAIDDILELLRTNPSEQQNLLALLYSPVIWLQNNLFVNFFTIWIETVYIEDIWRTNRFLKNEAQIREPSSYVTITFKYQIPVPAKKLETLW